MPRVGRQPRAVVLTPVKRLCDQSCGTAACGNARRAAIIICAGVSLSLCAQAIEQSINVNSAISVAGRFTGASSGSIAAAIVAKLQALVSPASAHCFRQAPCLSRIALLAMAASSGPPEFSTVHGCENTLYQCHKGWYIGSLRQDLQRAGTQDAASPGHLPN